VKFWGLVAYGWRLTRSTIRISRLKLAGAKIGKRVILESSLRNIPARQIVIGDGCVIEGHVVIGRLSKLTLGDYVKLKERTRIGGVDTHPKSLFLGSNSWIGEETCINTNEDVEIRDNVGVGARSQIWTHGYFSSIADGYPYKTGTVVVDTGVWLPPSCIILPDVEIGANTIVGTGSVVTKSLPPDVFATGAPCVVKQNDQWKYRKKLDLTEKMKVVKEQFLLGVRDLGFNFREVDKDEFKISKAWYKFHVDFDGDCRSSSRKRQVSFISNGLPSCAGANHTIVDIATNTYAKTGSLAEWIVIRILLDRCVLRLVADQ